MHLKFSTLFLIFIGICLVPIFGATINSKRSIKSVRSTNANEQTPSPTVICQKRTPCGWAVYDKITRYIDYFMENKCECPKDKQCLRTDDDISITAYVYRCRVPNS